MANINRTRRSKHEIGTPPPERKLIRRCNSCALDTNHQVLFETTIETEEQLSEEDVVSYQDDWKMIQCCGCDSISMIKESWCSWECDESGNYQKQISYFPPRIFKQPPKWIQDDHFGEFLPNEIGTLLSELYVTLQNNCVAAATMLMRSIIETVMISKCGDTGTFNDKLQKLESLGDIGMKEKDMLSSLIEAGHAATHRNFFLSKSDVVDLVEILESLLTKIYHQHQKSQKIRRKIPPRNKSRKLGTNINSI